MQYTSEMRMPVRRRKNAGRWRVVQKTGWQTVPLVIRMFVWFIVISSVLSGIVLILASAFFYGDGYKNTRQQIENDKRKQYGVK